jgi:hypothetical protein
MARITRREFVRATSALAAAPALAAVTARAQPPAPDIGNLRAEKDVVFGKSGDVDLLLDVYRPPEGVTPKRMAIVHLFGGGFSPATRMRGTSSTTPRRSAPAAIRTSPRTTGCRAKLHGPRRFTT